MRVGKAHDIPSCVRYGPLWGLESGARILMNKQRGKRPPRQQPGTDRFQLQDERPRPREIFSEKGSVGNSRLVL